jgi:hypothetical protein
MAAPPPPQCPQPQDFSILTGFITPETDLPPPHGLDAGMTMAVLDPEENDEVIRIVETSARFSVLVQWCICGPVAPAICGTWEVRLFIDDIDGVGPTSGQLGSTALVPVDPQNLCYTQRFEFSAGTVGAGVYDLVAIVTLKTAAGKRLGDTLGYAQIPVLAFFQD